VAVSTTTLHRIHSILTCFLLTSIAILSALTVHLTTISKLSLKVLLTELDVRIILLLPCPTDRSHVVKLSRYYREVGEPLLYEGLVLDSAEDDRIKLLLLTLSARSDLRHKVKTFTLRDNRPVLLPKLDDIIISGSSLQDEQLCDRLWTRTDHISACIQKIRPNFRLDAEFRAT
jgi:hypothetical protein